MRITKLKIKNLFGITAHEGGNSDVEYSGKNGVGKTSVLDAIKFVLTHKSDREYVIKNGENEGEILIETDTGLSIHRKVRTGMTDYTNVKQGKDTINSPESFLQSIFTTLQLNPMEFISMKKKEQNAIILDMIKYDWTLDTIREWFGELPRDINYEQNILAVLNDIQAENGYYYQHRQDVNREIKAKNSVIEDIGVNLPIGYDGAKWENANIGDLYTKIERIRKENSEIEKAKQIVATHDNKLRAFQADKEIKEAALTKELSAERERLTNELSQIEERKLALNDKLASLEKTKEDRLKVIESEYKVNVSEFESEVKGYAEFADKSLTDIADLLEEADTTEKMKSHVNEWRRMLFIQEEVEELKEESRLLTEKIEKARNLPGEILATAIIPVEGLTVKDGIPLINGLPISNLSEGEKLDLAVDVSISNPQGLNIILIDGVEKLTAENRNRLYKKCKDKGIQFLATRTTDDDELTVTEL